MRLRPVRSLTWSPHGSPRHRAPAAATARYPAGPLDALDAADAAFRLLTTGPAPLAVHASRLAAGLPGRLVPLDELRVLLLHPATSAYARNATRLARAVDQPTRLDNEILSYFRRALSEYYSADKMIGPARLIGPVLAQIEVLDSLRRGARPPHADPLLRILSQYGEMAGWLLQDSGDLDAAASWSRRAAEWAHCAGDTQMAAYMLIRQSNIATMTDDHTAVVHLAAAARRMPGPAEPKLTALALQQQARGHARLGEFRTCFALLDQAAETLRDHPAVSDPGAPEYLYHYDLSTLEEQTAVCYREAGRADTAVTILENKISTIPATLARDRGHLTAKLAVAVTQASEPDPGRAAHLGLTALTISGQTRSARTIRELRTLEGQLLAQWPHHPQTVSFSEALAAA
jgi:hypothetical protein